MDGLFSVFISNTIIFINIIINIVITSSHFPFLPASPFKYVFFLFSVSYYLFIIFSLLLPLSSLSTPLPISQTT